MEELLRPATEVTMSSLRPVSSSATETSDWKAEEASQARMKKLDKLLTFVLGI